MAVRRFIEALDRNGTLALEVGPLRLRARGIVGILGALIALVLIGLIGVLS